MMKLLAECQTDAMKPGGRERVRKRALALEHFYVLASEVGATTEIPVDFAWKGEPLTLHEIRSLIEQLHSIANGGRE